MNILRKLAFGGNYYYLQGGHSRATAISRTVIALFVVPLMGLLGAVYAFVGNIYHYILSYPYLFLILGLGCSLFVNSIVEKYMVNHFDYASDYSREAFAFRIYQDVIVLLLLIIWILPALLNIKY